ncbi:hypothetical protein ACRQ5D_14320 [Mucilaginibacter sp. P25]
MMNPKPAESEQPVEEAKPSAEIPQPTIEEVKPGSEPPAPKLGFKPRFNAAAMKPTVPEAEASAEDKKEDTPTEEPQSPAKEAPAPKLGFKPRFNAKNLPKKSEGDE